MSHRIRTTVTAGLSLAALAVTVTACGSPASHRTAPPTVTAPRITATATVTARPTVTATATVTARPTVTAAPATTAPAAPATPVMTTSEAEAVTAAQGYLDLGSGFSQYSLTQQLTSDYGNGFGQADAVYAISYLNPGWDAQAVEAAQGYLQLGTGFSASSLTQQLTSDYGNGFTYAQAEYAVAKVGL